jgi:hypothetical protein
MKRALAQIIVFKLHIMSGLWLKIALLNLRGSHEPYIRNQIKDRGLNQDPDFDKDWFNLQFLLRLIEF